MTPAKAVELLEVMKNFLDIKGCVFVLAVDYSVVSRGVREKYGEDIDEIKGRSFFDKIIQLPYNLPVGNYDIKRYLQKILHLDEDELEHYVDLAKYSVSTNPRALKRMANILILLEKVAKKYEKEDRDKPEFRFALFGVLCLQLAYTPVYEQILQEKIINESFWDQIICENIENIFSQALEECPGDTKKSKDHLYKFFNVLNDGLRSFEDNTNILNKIFNTVLDMSGITAAGSQVTINITDAQKESFDPLLLARNKELVERITNEYKTLWEAFGRSPTLVWDGAIIVIPINQDGSATFNIFVKHDGFEYYFYSQKGRGSAESVKYPVRDVIYKIAPGFIKSAKFNGKSNSFLTFPVVPWHIDISKKGEESSNLRFEQLKNYILPLIASFLPGIEKAYQQK